MAKRKKKSNLPKKTTETVNPILDSQNMQKDKKQFMSFIQKQMEQQDFKNADEANAFLKQFEGRNINNILAEWDTREASDYDRAIDTLGDWKNELFGEGNATSVRKNAQKAIEICNDCLEAWDALGNSYLQPKKALETFKEGIKIGREKFASLLPEEGEEGELWGYVEARPLMCLYESLAIHYLNHREDTLCCEVYIEMIRLNSSDNQGVRPYLLLQLIILGKITQAKEVLALFPDDAMLGVNVAEATIQMLEEAYSASEANLEKLKKLLDQGESTAIFSLFPKSKKLLQKLNKRNPFLKTFIVDGAVYDLPNPDYLTYGGANEAVDIARDYNRLWEAIAVPMTLIRIYPWEKPTKVTEDSKAWLDMLAKASANYNLTD